MSERKDTKRAVLGSDLIVRIDGREIGRVFRHAGRFNPAILAGGGYHPICRISFFTAAQAAKALARRVGAVLEVTR